MNWLKRLFSQPKQEPTSLTRTMRARLEGARDRRLGYFLSENRYSRDGEASLWLAWKAGWREARR